MIRITVRSAMLIVCLIPNQFKQQSGADKQPGRLQPLPGLEVKFDLFPRDQFDDYINQVWAMYMTETLTATITGSEQI